MAVEFQILMGPEARKIDPDCIKWPDDTIGVFAREGADIVGRSTIVQLPHIEGTWVRNDFRGSTLAFRLVEKIESILKKANKSSAFAFIYDEQPEIASYMERRGYKKMPLAVYQKELS